MLIEIFLSYIISKFIDAILDRGKEDDKQKDAPIVIINGNVIVTNINVDDDKEQL